MRHNRKKIYLVASRIIYPLLALIVAAGPVAVCFNVPEAVAGSRKTAARTANERQSKKDKQENNEAALNKTDEKASSASEEIKNDPGDMPLKDYTEDDFRPQVEEESFLWLFIKTILVLGLLIGGFYYIFRFLGKKAGIQLLGGEVAQVLSVVPIGQNRYLQIIDLAGRVLVLGVCDSSINLITEITDKDEIDRIRIKGQTRVPTVQGGFQEYLVRGIGKIIDKVNEKKNRSRSFKQTDGISPGTDLDYLKEQRKRLKNLNGYDKE